MEVRLLGRVDKEFIDGQLNICAAAGKLSRMKGTVFDAVDSMKDPNKAIDFIKRVIKMGHTSTIDHDYMVFAISEVSPVVEQTIIAERFSSFTIKSRREVDFSSVGFYTPDFHDLNGNILKNNKELQEKYQNHMKSLFDSYQTFIDNGINKEDSRFILPYSYHSEIIMGLDGTSLARMINSLTKSKLSNITELKLLGKTLLNVTKERAPYLSVLIDNYEEKLESDADAILNDLGIEKEYSLVDEPVLLSYTNNLDKTIFTNAISRISGKSIDESEKIFEEKFKDNNELQEKFMKSIFNELNCEDLRQVNLRFQASIPLAILTHYTRHRRISLSIPAFSPLIDTSLYVTPPSIKSKSDLNKLYDEVYKNNTKVLEEFKKMNVRDEDLVYFSLSGNAINVIMNFDGEAFRWICRLRECTKAQWCIRNCVGKMHKLVDRISTYYAANLGPDCVTKHACMEGTESCGRINKILEDIEKKKV